MAAEVAAQQSNFWIYTYDSLAQFISKARTLLESEQGCARANQSTFIRDLPEEILLLIFKYLSQPTLAKCERVCKNWLHTIRSSGSQLWHHADIRYDLAPKFRSRSYSGSRRLDPHEKLELYVQYLLQMMPRLRTLSVCLDLMNEKAFKAIEFLITSGYCLDLKDVRIRWIDDDPVNDYIAYREQTYDKSCFLYNETLKLLVKHSPNITHFQTQLNFSFDSLKCLHKLSNLRELDIVCVPRVALLMPWHIEKILTTLTKLKVFRLQVTVNHSQFSNTLSKFTVASNSLHTLDLSYCVNFVISSMDLPNLQVFQAFETKMHSVFQHGNDIPCVYDALSAGCPRLNEINGMPVSHKEAISGLSSIKHKQLNICFCAKKHMNG